MNTNPPSPGSISRREFVHLSAASLATAGFGLSVAQGALGAEPRRIPIGLELYSVREQAAKDVAGVLAAVGKMGYEAVEFAGYYGHKAPELRKLLDDNGLRCCGTHTGLDTVLGDALKGTIEFNRTLGNQLLIVPSMPRQRTGTRQGWLDNAKLFNELADKVKGDGMRVGYHAHSEDFKLLEGETPWDVFFGNTRKEVVMQLDTGNCLDGGGDPVAILRKYGNRAVTIHVKEHGGDAQTVIGGGDMKWKEVIALCRAGATEVFVIEHERGGPDPLADVKRCLEGFKALLQA